MRYAKTEIKITIKNKKIILFNDGDKIDENILSSIFTPYEKGLNGMFGLGLSMGIAKLDVMPIIYDGYILYDNRKVYGKTLNLDNYSISVCSFKEINKLDLEYF